MLDAKLLMAPLIPQKKFTAVMKCESMPNFTKCTLHPPNNLTYFWIYDLNMYQVLILRETKHICTFMYVDAVLVRQLVRLSSKAGGFQSLFSRFLKEIKN